MKERNATTGTKINIADVDFIETNNVGQIVITMKNTNSWIVPITMALVFQNDKIVIG